MASVIGPKADLRIVNARVSPDGFSRVGALADGSFPGPVITSTKGVGLEINVIDELTDDTMTKSTSIHWHGLIMKGRNWADGPTSVNQCPISPGHSFKYELPAGDQAGTFWYHSHLSTQYCDGLRGALVVYDPEDPHRGLYDVDDENTIITLVDWYRESLPTWMGLRVGTDAVRTVDDPSPSYVRKSFQAPDSTLINGLGRYKGGPSAPLAVINVKRGKRSAILLHADGPVDNYWIRAKPDVGNQDFKGGINQAILRYKGAAETDPTTESGPSMNQLMETDLHPLENPGAPGLPQPDGADINLNFALGFNPSTRLFDISGTPFIPPTVPVLLQIMSGAAAPGSLLPNGPVYALPLNKTIQISFPPGNAPGAPHPMHLHGHTFDVIRSAGSSEYNYVNPVRRDVVNTGVQEDNVTIRFKTDNAGPWFLHCHIDLHLEHGLAVVLAEDAPGTAKANLAPGQFPFRFPPPPPIDSQHGWLF
uniref:laccase n=1 Tax=Moniliophthora roreri TaxID=221103 RepID=A0A0W0FMU0_MONRR